MFVEGVKGVGGGGGELFWFGLGFLLGGVGGGEVITVYCYVNHLKETGFVVCFVLFLCYDFLGVVINTVYYYVNHLKGTLRVQVWQVHMFRRGAYRC